jgi:hypothetical protein
MTIWVSDAGGMYAPEEHPHRDGIRHTLRVIPLSTSNSVVDAAVVYLHLADKSPA